MKNKIITRTGKNASEVRRKWVWDHPNTVIEDIRYNGKTTRGIREYMIFYHERQKESKRSKTVMRLKSKGASFGRTSGKR